MNWLFLRGLTRERRHWGRFPAVFESANKGARVHCLDLPGSGTELLRDSPVSIHGIAEDVRVRWSELKKTFEGPWSCLAISLGGMVALDWAATHPGDFERAVVLCSSAANLSLPWERLNPFVIKGLLEAGLVRESFARERRILEMCTALQTDPDRVAGEWASISSDSGRLRMTFIRQIAAATRFFAPARLSCPALFLTSMNDRFTHPSCSFRLAKRYGAALRCHEKAGHELALDAPEWVASETKSWIEFR